MAGINVGTGREASYCVQEEYLPTILGTVSDDPVSSKIWFIRRRHSLQRIPSFVPTSIASSYDAPVNGLAVESPMGMHDIQIDFRTIGLLLKGFFGSYSKTNDSPQAGVTTHVFTPGSSEKTFQILEDKGHLSTPYYRKYQGMFPNRIAFNCGINDWLWASIGYLGMDEVAGTDPGTASPENSSICAGFNQIQYYIGLSGAETIAGMTKLSYLASTLWTDPYDAQITFARPDAIADDIRSDKTGKSSSIFTGTFSSAINLMTRLDVTHILSTFDANEKVSFGIRMLTDTEIVAAGQHYGMDLIFPKCTIQSVSVDFQGSGQAVPVIALIPEPDYTVVSPATSYSAKAILYNNRLEYTSPTAP